MNKKMEFSNKLPNFNINIFDEERNKIINGRFVPMTDSEVDYLSDTEKNAKEKDTVRHTFSQELFHQCPYNTQNMTCQLVDTNLILLCSGQYLT